MGLGTTPQNCHIDTNPLTSVPNPRPSLPPLYVAATGPPPQRGSLTSSNPTVRVPAAAYSQGNGSGAPVKAHGIDKLLLYGHYLVHLVGGWQGCWQACWQAGG